jgi:hypothetical protein
MAKVSERLSFTERLSVTAPFLREISWAKTI